MVIHAEMKILWCWITELSKLFCCVTRINQLCVPVGECWDPGLKIVSFPLWERRQSRLTHGQNSHASCRVAARQLHLSAVHKNTPTQNNSAFTSSAGSELVIRESSDVSHYSHSNTSVAYDYYANTGLKWHTPFPACTQTLTHKTSLTLVHSANKADSPVLPSSGPVQGQEQSFFSHLHTTQRL